MQCIRVSGYPNVNCQLFWEARLLGKYSSFQLPVSEETLSDNFFKKLKILDFIISSFHRYISADKISFDRIVISGRFPFQFVILLALVHTVL